MEVLLLLSYLRARVHLLTIYAIIKHVKRRNVSVSLV